MRNASLFAILGIAALMAALAGSSFANAGTITVTNTNDDGPGSLRQAVGDWVPGVKRIVFDPSLDGQPIIINGGLTISSPSPSSPPSLFLEIIGRGPDNTIIEGSVSISRMRYGGVTISDMTIRNGVTLGNSGILTLRNCLISGNNSGGIYNRGTLLLQSSVVRNNSNPWVFNAGGIYNSGALTMEDTTVTGNSTDGSFDTAGGIYNSGRMTAAQSTITANVARSGWTAGVYNQGTAVFNDSMILDNNIGVWGVLNRKKGSGLGRLTLNRTTVSDSRLVNSLGTIALINSTVSGSILNGDGASLDLKSSTVSHVESDGSFGEVTFVRSIVESCSGENFESQGYNLGPHACGLSQPSDLPGVSAMLGPLADNGGPTLTRALMSESPAIDSGGEACEETDQRGTSRPLDGDGDGVARCDIGAFEYSPFPVVISINGMILTLIGADYDLVAPLQQAIQILDDGDPGNDGGAVEHIHAFIEGVEADRGLTLTDEEADELIAEAQLIIRQLDYGASPDHSFWP